MILASGGNDFKFKVTYYILKMCWSFPTPLLSFPLAVFLCWPLLCPTRYFSSLLSRRPTSLYSPLFLGPLSAPRNGPYSITALPACFSSASPLQAAFTGTLFSKL